MAMRVLAGRVEFMLMMGVLDRADLQAPPVELSDEFAQQCRLAVVLSADDVHSSHWQRILFSV